MPKILVVEDNEENREMLCRRLKRRAYFVIAAADGEQGYSLACSEQPDLILMDVGLPQMDGWQAIRLLRATKATSHIPIIVLTAHAMLTDRDKSFEAGCDSFCSKPIDFRQLIDAIDHLLTCAT